MKSKRKTDGHGSLEGQQTIIYIWYYTTLALIKLSKFSFISFRVVFRLYDIFTIT